MEGEGEELLRELEVLRRGTMGRGWGDKGGMCEERKRNVCRFKCGLCFMEIKCFRQASGKGSSSLRLCGCVRRIFL